MFIGFTAGSDCFFFLLATSVCMSGIMKVIWQETGARNPMCSHPFQSQLRVMFICYGNMIWIEPNVHENIPSI